ncbi:MAG TPA: LamG domain-containing protein [Anaerohalosphaeraceae bacterium]|nr:LamG domain-containing protein [Anaerohalosphaeraceae bacterium]HQG05492.1 LamG domain-containing protein [Anaerohalosphaeraceae bacterium]HQI06865.1 LamG domain-containing protein [Anaerohalosphaeraceae bacterium]HQJ68549.1 LamG domain-containing protein [Anaerohalosphaeraceae bacterium]
MREKIFVMMLLLGLIGSVQAVLVDDFESYLPGVITQVTGGKWVPVFGGVGTDPGADSTVRQIAADPTNPMNQVIYVETNNAGQYGMYGVIPAEAAIKDNTVGTLFLQFYVTTTALDESFGLTSIDAPTSGGFGNFNCQVALVRGNLLVRNGGSSTTVGTFQANTWYYIWIVVNNTANTYSVYIKNTPSDATAADRVAQDFAFRSGSTDGDLDRFYTIANYGSNITSGTRLHFDNIVTSPGQNLSIYVPGSAYNPYPANGATQVPLDVTLSWNTGMDPSNPSQFNPNITRHYLYLRYTEPNFLDVTPIVIPAAGATASYTPPLPLEADRTYYWRVDESILDSSPRDPNTITGPVWRFNTIPAVPFIEVQPMEARVDGSNPTPPAAEFTVVYRSELSPANSTWKKYVDGVNDVELTSGSKYTIVHTDTTSTLLIHNPGLDDQGWYYCELKNPEGTRVTERAALIVNRVLAQYDFENNFNDMMGENHGVGKDYADPNNPLAGPTFDSVDGIDGAYGVFNGLGEYVDLGSSAYPKAGFTNGMAEGTILCWVKPTQAGTVLLNYNDGATTGFGFSVNASSNARLNIRGEGLQQEYQEIGTAEGRPGMTGFSLYDGRWHLVGATWKEGDTLRIYVDGEQVASVTAGKPDQYLPWQYGVLIGASRTSDNRTVLTNFFGGAVDNLRVYNYVVSGTTIAQEYADKSGFRPCLTPSFDGNAYNFDNTIDSYCRVDLVDFAIFAQNWLACGLYPDCQ